MDVVRRAFYSRMAAAKDAGTATIGASQNTSAAASGLI